MFIVYITRIIKKHFKNERVCRDMYQNRKSTGLSDSYLFFYSSYYFKDSCIFSLAIFKLQQTAFFKQPRPQNDISALETRKQVYINNLTPN